MAEFDFVLFDADNTLYDFDRAEHEALKSVLAAHGYPTDQATLEVYLAANRDLWARFDRGEVTQAYLVVERFAAFVRAMGGGTVPRPGPPLHPGHRHQRGGPRPAGAV